MREDEFQTLYILTCQKIFGKIRSLGKSQEEARKLLVDLYVKIYEDSGQIPKNSDEFLSWAENLICGMLGEDEGEKAVEIFHEIRETELKERAEKVKKAAESGEREDGHARAEILKKISEEKLPEDKVTSLWMEIEERLGNLPGGRETSQAGGDDKDEGSGEDKMSERAGFAYSVFKIILAAAVVIGTAALFVVGFQMIRDYKADRRAMEAKEESEAAARESEAMEKEMLRIEKESREIGWVKKPDGNLYYIAKNREEARGALALGGQVFVFSHNGILTSIQEGSGVYNEETVYLVDQKDVYMQEPGEERQRIILNGHVEKVDVFDQNLYYICTYQIPNSHQVKTAVWKADLNGEHEELVFETMSALNTEHFQAAEKWYYYINDGQLIRMNYDNGRTELMGSDVENYFVWEDVVYYMDGGALRTVTEGEPYRDLSTYSFQPDGDTFVIEDASGQPAEGDENGTIQIEDRIFGIEDGRIKSVRQAAREADGNSYELRDGKIYWSDEESSGGLLRQSGVRTDSFCIADRWLYYSAWLGDDGRGESRLYRLNLDTMEEEPAGGAFAGRIKALYYSEKDGCVYGEYSAGNEGQIACIPENGGVYRVDAAGDLPDGGRGNTQWLRFLFSNGDKIYCLWEDCNGDPTASGAQILETRPVTLERERLVYMGD